ncbi:MAG TPA: thiol:disulfide interchange protein DsbG [Burkholderiaceae bacterium]|nr:thiol:disulfide interchange protein DsbG [Burkholderiaceae bacterium]
MLSRPSLYRLFLGALALFLSMTGYAAETALPPSVKALQSQGLDVMGEFNVGDGLRAFAGAAGDRPLAIYVTQDGSAIIGTRVGPDGKALDEGRLQDLVAKPMAKRAWSALEKATWVQDGKKDAPRIIYTFSDPNCPYCHKFWEASRPWVKSGAVQLRHLVVAVIRPDSATKAATILGAKDRSAELTKNEMTFSEGGIKPAESVPPAIQTILDENQELMMNMGFRGTPGIVAMRSDGLLEKINGLPQPAALAELLGPNPGSPSAKTK